jgi:hypothetical protein
MLGISDICGWKAFRQEGNSEIIASHKNKWIKRIHG